MIKSPLLEKIAAEAMHDVTLDALEDRFGSVPPDVVQQLRAILKVRKARKLSRIARNCADLEAFRAALMG